MLKPTCDICGKPLDTDFDDITRDADGALCHTECLVEADAEEFPDHKLDDPRRGAGARRRA